MFAMFMAAVGAVVLIVGSTASDNKPMIAGVICLLVAGLVWWRESR